MLGEYTDRGTYQYKQLPFSTIGRIENGTYLVLALPISKKELSIINHFKVYNNKELGLNLHGKSIIGAGKTSDIEINPVILNDILRHGNFHIPIGYDFDTRECKTFPYKDKMMVKETETTTHEYFKYHFSIVGNPEFVMLFSIQHSKLKNTPMYIDFINSSAKPYENIRR